MDSPCFFSITQDDARYPKALATIFDPPKELHVRGLLPDPTMPLVAVVGARKMTAYGRQVIQKLVAPLAASGVGIVSGLAYGCDGEAHRVTLAAGGTAYAVLGSGIDETSLYPQDHRGLAREIVAQGGAIMSEYPEGTRSQKAYFPQRNRIVAGMSRGVLIVEARIQSGSLITARAALEMGREVFAVPGAITSELSEGTNWLIQNGAHLVTSAQDIFEILQLEQKPQEEKQQLPLLPEAAQLLHTLREPRTLDELIISTRRTAADLGAALTMLELNAQVIRHGDRWLKTSA